MQENIVILKCTLFYLLCGDDHSIARQCIHCCKGDPVSQWERAILGVSELRNP